MRILLVEDDALLGDGIRAGLKLADYAVDWVRDGDAARLALLDHDYHACILDLGLPRRDGLSVLKDLRRNGKQLPVLILTARDTSADKIAGLDAGADDYLTKPFHPDELLLRLRALVRRSAGHASPVLRAGAIELDANAGRVQVDGRPVELTAQELRILSYLVHHAGEVVSRTRLGEHVYDAGYDPESNVIDVLIGRIRRKLGDPGLIRTLRGRGFLVGDEAA